MRSRKLASLLFVMLMTGQFAFAMALRAQAPNSEATSSPSPAASPKPAISPAPSPSPAQPATTSSQVVPKVISVDGHLELDAVVKVHIENLAEWSLTHDPTKLIPYINGRAIRGNYPEEIHSARNHVYFHFEITPENKEVWTDLLGEPNGTYRPVTLSVGPENQTPFDTHFDQSNRLPLTVISPMYGILALIVVLVTLVVFIVLARRTNILRESGPNPGAGKLKPYNLGRTQMAIWFFLIFISYQAIWIITGSLDTITPSLLALMGISAGTALSDALIDSGKESTSESQLRDLTAEQQSLQQSITGLQAKLDAAAPGSTTTPQQLLNRDDLAKQLLDQHTRLGQVTQQIQALTPSATSNVTGGFLRDILSDANGYSFHRFQIFAWTIVLGIIFLSSVYNSLTMPEFSATLLGLMGISSGTYLGFKFPEKK